MPFTMKFLGRKRKVPHCLLLLAQLSGRSHAQYSSCQETLSRSDVDGDAILQANEIPEFIVRLSSGIINSTSIEGLPVPFQEVFSSRANAINLLGISDPTADLLELDSFCEDVYGALGEYLGISITQNVCIGALQAADTSPGNGRVSFEPEFLVFTTSLAGTDFGVTTAAELPSGMIQVYDDFSGGSDVKSSAGLDYLVQFCQRTALQAKIEADKPDQPETPAPSALRVVSTNAPVVAAPVVSLTLAPVIAPSVPPPDSPPPNVVSSSPVVAPSVSLSPVVAPSSTELFVLTDELYALCLESMQVSDTNGNNLLESSEYPLFLDGLLEGTYATTPFDELDPLLQTAFGDFVVVRDSINLFGAKPGETPDAGQTSYLRAVCSAAGQADLDLTTSGGGEESTPNPAPVGSVTTSPAPADGLVSTECQTAIDAGGSWTKDSYAFFVQTLDPSLEGTFATLPYSLQDNYYWILNGEDSIVIPDSPLGEAYARFICDRTKRIMEQPENGQTLQQQCEIALQVASGDNATLSSVEYVVFLNHLSGFAWEGMPFDALDVVLQDVFEERESEGKVDARTGEFCEATSQALEITRTENKFFQRCLISLIGANANLDESMSAAEFAEFFSSLDGSPGDAIFDDLPDDAKVNYERLAQDDRIQVAGLLSLDRNKEEADNLRMICDSIEPLVDDPLGGGNTTRVTIFNAFVVRNDLGLTQIDVETGELRDIMENAYRNFVTAQFAKLVELTDGRRRLSGAVLLDETIRLYRIEDDQCPSGATGSCQRIFGSFDVETAQVDPNLSNEYIAATQAAIDDGALQDEVVALDPDFDLVVFSSSKLVRPDDGVVPSAIESEKDNTVLVSVLTVLFGTLFGMLGAGAVAYYIVRKNLPTTRQDTNEMKVDPELALMDNFDMEYDAPEAASMEDPYGHLAVFDKNPRSKRQETRANENEVSEHSSSNNSEKVGFETFEEDSGGATRDISFMLQPSSTVPDDQMDGANIYSDAMFRKDEIRWNNDSPIMSPGDPKNDPRGEDEERNDGDSSFDEEHPDEDASEEEFQALPSAPNLHETEQQHQTEYDQEGSSESYGSEPHSQYDLDADIQDYDEMRAAPQTDEEGASYEDEYSEEVQEEEYLEELEDEEYSEEIEEEEISEETIEEEEKEESVLENDVQSGGSSHDLVDVEDGESEQEGSEDGDGEMELDASEDEQEEAGDSDMGSETEEADPPYRDEIAALMEQVMPDELENLDAMLEQFSGREAELLETLENMINAESDDEDEEDYTEEDEDAEESEHDEEDQRDEERSDSGTDDGDTDNEAEQADASQSEEEETKAGASESEGEESEAAESVDEESETVASEEEESETAESESEEESEAEESESEDESDSDDSDSS